MNTFSADDPVLNKALMTMNTISVDTLTSNKSSMTFNTFSVNQNSALHKPKKYRKNKTKWYRPKKSRKCNNTIVNRPQQYTGIKHSLQESTETASAHSGPSPYKEQTHQSEPILEPTQITTTTDTAVIHNLALALDEKQPSQKLSRKVAIAQSEQLQ